MDNSRIMKLERTIEEMLLEREQILKDMEALEETCEIQEEENKKLKESILRYEMKDLGVSNDGKCEERN